MVLAKTRVHPAIISGSTKTHRKQYLPEKEERCPCWCWGWCDMLYQEKTDAEKQEWNDALKKNGMSGYDLWMKEAITLVLRGDNAPDHPSVSGGYSTNYVEAGSDDLPDEWIGQYVPPPPPDANFFESIHAGPAPLEVQFTDTSTGEIHTWHWDFGDGNEAYEQHPLHEYLVPGPYIVTLTVTGPGGSDFERDNKTVTAVPWPPGADCEYCTGDAPSKRTIEFSGFVGDYSVFNQSVVTYSYWNCSWTAKIYYEPTKFLYVRHSARDGPSLSLMIDGNGDWPGEINFSADEWAGDCYASTDHVYDDSEGGWGSQWLATAVSSGYQ